MKLHFIDSVAQIDEFLPKRASAYLDEKNVTTDWIGDDFLGGDYAINCNLSETRYVGFVEDEPIYISHYSNVMTIKPIHGIDSDSRSLVFFTLKDLFDNKQEDDNLVIFCRELEKEFVLTFYFDISDEQTD